MLELCATLSAAPSNARSGRMRHSGRGEAFQNKPASPCSGIGAYMPACAKPLLRHRRVHAGLRPRGAGGPHDMRFCQVLPALWARGVSGRYARTSRVVLRKLRGMRRRDAHPPCRIPCRSVFRFGGRGTGAQPSVGPAPPTRTRYSLRLAAGSAPLSGNRRPSCSVPEWISRNLFRSTTMRKVLGSGIVLASLTLLPAMLLAQEPSTCGLCPSATVKPAGQVKGPMGSETILRHVRGAPGTLYAYSHPELDRRLSQLAAAYGR